MAAVSDVPDVFRQKIAGSLSAIVFERQSYLAPVGPGTLGGATLLYGFGISRSRQIF